MDTKTTEDLVTIRGTAAAVHRDIRDMANKNPCVELNLAEKYMNMAVQAMSAKLKGVATEETETEPSKEEIVYFLKQLNAENPK